MLIPASFGKNAVTSASKAISKKISKNIKPAHNTKSLKDKASDLSNSLNKGKNSITVDSANKRFRYDLKGKSHGGIDTPHVHEYKKNIKDGVQKSISEISKNSPRALDKFDIRSLNKILRKRNEK